MTTKQELQTVLKEKHGINKNISKSLNSQECERLLDLLHTESSAVKLIESFIQKNSELGNNNKTLGQRRSHADNKFARIQTEYRELEISIANLENSKLSLEQRKQKLEQESQKLDGEIKKISTANENLIAKVETLTTHNDELVTANQQLKAENKDLKNIVDQIRFRLARDTEELLKYEDSEIRKALIRLFKWTIG